MNLQNFIDHTLLKPTATEVEIAQLCKEAVQHGFFAVCVNGCYISFAKKLLGKSAVRLACVVGFPLGASSTETKRLEALEAIRNGADEIDMVLNIGWLMAGNIGAVEEEIAQIKKTIGTKVLKVILETGYLSSDEIEQGCRAAMNAKADFVKTSTGFGPRGASLEDIERMKGVIGDRLRIKASGGIKDAATAKKYIESGVSRIGTSSGLAIIAP